MKRQMALAIAGLYMLALGGCNTSDALTPKEDIPNPGKTADAQPAAEQPVAVGQPAAQPGRQLYQQQASLPPIDGGDDPSASPQPGPQNTLEAQADALARGEANPSATRPPVDGSLGSNLYRSDSAAKAAGSIYSTQAAKGTIRFLPIIGAPVQAVTPLSKELGASARGNGLTIKSSNDQTAEHVLKGYLSAFGDGKKITIIYVWDVLDNSGARLHRIQGQEEVPGTGSDAWASVPPEVMQQIGSNTIAEYMKWRDNKV